MMISLLACALYPEPADVPSWPRVGTRVEVEITARVGEPEGPVAWAARAQVGISGPAAVAGCHPVPDASTVGPGVERIAVDVPAAADLVWEAERHTWRAEGPRSAVDPAWAVGTVLWVEEGRPALATGAVRFGGRTTVHGTARDDDGSVWVWWGDTDDHVVVRTDAGGRAYDCVGEGNAVLVPWWLVPPSGGEVTLRTERERTTIVPDAGIVHVRAVLEEVIELDVPLTTRGVPAPAPSVPRDRPKRLIRHVPFMG